MFGLFLLAVLSLIIFSWNHYWLFNFEFFFFFWVHSRLCISFSIESLFLGGDYSSSRIFHDFSIYIKVFASAFVFSSPHKYSNCFHLRWICAHQLAAIGRKEMEWKFHPKNISRANENWQKWKEWKVDNEREDELFWASKCWLCDEEANWAPKLTWEAANTSTKKQKQIKKMRERREFWWKVFLTNFYSNLCYFLWLLVPLSLGSQTTAKEPGRKEKEKLHKKKREKKRDLCAVIICFFHHSSCTWRGRHFGSCEQDKVAAAVARFLCGQGDFDWFYVNASWIKLQKNCSTFS